MITRREVFKLMAATAMLSFAGMTGLAKTRLADLEDVDLTGVASNDHLIMDLGRWQKPKGPVDGDMWMNITPDKGEYTLQVRIDGQNVEVVRV